MSPWWAPSAATPKVGNASHRPVEPPWLAAGTLVLAVHGAILFGLLTARAPLDPIPAGPAVLVELLPPDEPAPEVVDEPDLPTPPPPEPPPPPVVRPPIEVAPVAAPLPKEVVAVPPPPPPPPPDVVAEPAPTPERPVARPATPTVATASVSVPAANLEPRAKQQEMDYFSLVNAHLARNKRYPRKARRARQQGVVTVRFTVHRDGRVSGAEIRQSSGQALLDAATLDLLDRVSPLPRFPREMTRQSVTVTLPIDYSLRTD